MTRFGALGLLTLCLVYLANVQAREGVGKGEQDWGYVTVRPGAHMFWWLYYTTNKAINSHYEKPLVIWLQGGPGGSSTGFGNFGELGPYDVHLEPRNYTWVKDYNVLFIDNPVGSGFSYADSESALTKTNAQIAEDLLQLMRGFYKKLPRFLKVPVYITSESYGGKMAAEFALVWHKAEKLGSIESNLKGVGLGDSWISPIDSVLTWAPFLLQTGMVDAEGAKRIEKVANTTRDAVENGQWTLATRLWARTEEAILRETRNIDFYNILTKMRTSSKVIDLIKERKFKALEIFKMISHFDAVSLDRLMNTIVKKILNLNVTWGYQSGAVFSMLSGDFMKPVINVVERLLDETDLKVFVYTGQLDLIVDTPGTLKWVEKMHWKNANEWKTSKRNPVVIDGIIEGYRKSYGKFAFYWVNRAGHMVPADNPPATAAILEDLTRE